MIVCVCVCVCVRASYSLSLSLSLSLSFSYRGLHTCLNAVSGECNEPGITAGVPQVSSLSLKVTSHLLNAVDNLV